MDSTASSGVNDSTEVDSQNEASFNKKHTKANGDEIQRSSCDCTRSHKWAHTFHHPMSSESKLAYLSQTQSIIGSIEGSKSSAEDFAAHHVHILDDNQFNDLCRKAKVQPTVLLNDKRQKNEIRQQKVKIQQLKAEVFRLRQSEAQLEQYEHRSVKTLKKELRMRRNEVADLSIKIQNAAREENEWVRRSTSCLESFKPFTGIPW
ncbi:hypothetical protein Plhal304r1_c102g0175281 [Plasmopara halstedii]